MPSDLAEHVFIDLAVESKSLPLRINENPLLLLGFSTRKPGENPLALARSLKKNSKLGISIFNLETKDENNDPARLFTIAGLSLKVSFTASRNTQSTSTPLKQITYDQFRIYQDPDPNPRSYAFESNAFKAWNAFAESSGPVYPADQLQPHEVQKGPSSTFDRFEHPGAYFITVILDVILADGERVVFRTDPEMIVKTGPDDGGVVTA